MTTAAATPPHPTPPTPPSSSPRRTFLDLPTEVLLLILDRLSNEDLNSLFAIRAFKERVSGLFGVISDEASSRFSNIPAASQLTHNGVFKKDLFLIVEICNLRSNDNIITTLSNGISNKVSIYNQFVGDSMQDGRYSLKWMCTLGPKTRSVCFEDVQKLTLSDVEFDPSIFHFPKLERLKLIRCNSKNHAAKFDFPNLKHLKIEFYLYPMDKCIDFTSHSKLSTLSFSEIEDIPYWDTVESSSIQEITMTECDSLMKLSRLTFHNLTKLTIKDLDIREISYLSCPNLKLLHVEQFMQSIISIHDVDLPSLESILLWVFEIENLYNVNIPKVERASVMLSNEPLAYNNDQQVDLTCFKSLSSIQLCLGIEIVQYVDCLQDLEVRGPFSNPILFQSKFTNLSKLHLYFNNSFTEVPKINAPNLKFLRLSRCISLRSLDSLSMTYPNLQNLEIEYSGLCKMIGLTFPKLKTFKYISSTSQPLIVKDCEFPSLKVFEATNLEIKSDERSVFQFLAPALILFKVKDFNIEELIISGLNFANLMQLRVIGGLEKLRLIHCESLKAMDISKNQLKEIEIVGELSQLKAFDCVSTNILDFEHVPGKIPLLKRVVYDEMVSFIPRDG